MSTKVYQYGNIKQKHYRDRIVAMILSKRNKRAMTVMSLCGRDAMRNRNSAELQLQRARIGTRLVLVDCLIGVCETLVKDLKARGYTCEIDQVWDGRFKQGRKVQGDGKRWIFKTSYGVIEVWCATAKSYIRWAAVNERKHDVMILDYYNHFMNYLDEDLKTVKDFDLVKENGMIFVSSPRPGLDINTRMVRGILKQGQGDYSRGMVKILRGHFNTRLSGAKKWAYKDDNSAIGMHVVALRFA